MKSYNLYILIRLIRVIRVRKGLLTITGYHKWFPIHAYTDCAV